MTLDGSPLRKEDIFALFAVFDAGERVKMRCLFASKFSRYVGRAAAVSIFAADVSRSVLAFPSPYPSPQRGEGTDRARC